jgi:hypothetical protein
MVKLTKEFELTVHDIIYAIRQLPLSEKKQILEVFKDEASGITAVKGKDIPQTIDLKAMMKERGYKGVDWQVIDDAVKKLNIQEPIEELLKDLD